VTVRVQIDGEEYVLDLRLNEDLVTDGHVLQYQRNGKTVTHRPGKEVTSQIHPIQMLLLLNTRQTKANCPSRLGR
jgi:hypothetical protein